MKVRIASYAIVALLAAGIGAGITSAVHEDDVPERSISGVVFNVNSEQTAIGIKANDGSTYAGLLAHNGPPLKAGQSVEAVVYGSNGEVIRVGEVD